MMNFKNFTFCICIRILHHVHPTHYMDYIHYLQHTTSLGYAKSKCKNTTISGMHILWLATWLKAAGRKGQLLRAIQEDAAAGFLVVSGIHVHRHKSMYKDRDIDRERGRVRHASRTATYMNARDGAPEREKVEGMLSSPSAPQIQTQCV